MHSRHSENEQCYQSSHTHPTALRAVHTELGVRYDVKRNNCSMLFTGCLDVLHTLRRFAHEDLLVTSAEAGASLEVVFTWLDGHRQ